MNADEGACVIGGRDVRDHETQWNFRGRPLTLETIWEAARRPLGVRRGMVMAVVRLAQLLGRRRPREALV